MILDLHCGPCESGLTLDSSDDDAVWMILHRFANAHIDCGWITAAGQQDGAPKTKMVLGPMDQPETESEPAETLEE